MKNTELARLEAVDPRTYWKNEAADFTPWLGQAENIKLLGDTIGLELEVESQEKSVGSFRADLLCKSTVDDSWVLIENQLERTDHSHLGQLLTYAAGLQAVTIVWIAREMTDEHRAALDWLNEVTDARINFFGLEIELWRIGGSPLAPKFNVVSKPNDWTKSTVVVELTDTKKMQRDYWEEFRGHVAKKGAEFQTTKPLPQGWMNIFVGRSGFHLSAIFSAWNSEESTYETGEIRAEFVVTSGAATELYDEFRTRQEEIQKKLGNEEQLTWHNPEETKSWKMYLRKTIEIADRSDWPTQHEWLRTRLNRLHKVFQPMVKELA